MTVSAGLLSGGLGGGRGMGRTDGRGDGKVRGGRKVEGGRGEGTSLLIELGVVEAVDDFRDGLDGAVPSVGGRGVSEGLAGGFALRVCGWRGGGGLLYILKLPPTKNWRGMIAVGGIDVGV